MITWKLRLAAAVVALAILGSAFLVPPAERPSGEYETAVMVLAGGMLIVGSLCLSSALGATLLRASGNGAFRAAYVAIMALSGVGSAEVLSAFYPVNVLPSLLAFSGIASLAGIYWWRYYALALR